MYKFVILLLFNITTLLTVTTKSYANSKYNLLNTQLENTPEYNKIYQLKKPDQELNKSSFAFKNDDKKEHELKTISEPSSKTFQNEDKKYKLENDFLGKLLNKVKTIYKFDDGSGKIEKKKYLIETKEDLRKGKIFFKRKKSLNNKNKENKNSDLFIPSGFEDLNEDSYILINIYYGDDLITNTFATANAREVIFSNPKKIVDNLSHIAKDLDQILYSLTGPLKTNSQYSCFPNITPGCGELPNVKIAKIIYSPDSFRADIMINKDYIKREDPLRNYVTSTQKGLSSITGFNNIFSGSNGANGKDFYSLNGTSIISHKNSNIETTYNYSEDSKISYDNILAKHYKKDTEFRLGLSSVQQLSMVSGPRFIGFGVNRFFTSSDEMGAIYGSKVELFLPYRSRVKIFKDGKLLHSDNYDFGNQVIDTSSLPTGAYDIDIEIQDGRGVDKNKMFFVKSNRMPPSNRPLYYLDFGVLQDSTTLPERNIPQASNNPIARIGSGKRITRSMSLVANILATEKEIVTEGSIEYEAKNFRLSNSYLITNKNDRGISIGIENNRSKGDKLNYNLGLRKVLQGKNDDEKIDTRLSYDSVNNSSSRYSMNVNYLIKEGSLGFQGQRSQNGTSPVAYSFGPFYERNLFRKNNFWVNFRGDVKKYQDRTDYLLNFRMFYNKGHWSVRSTTNKNFLKAQSVDSREDNNFRASQNVTWQDRDILDEDLTISALHNIDSGEENEEIGFDYKSKYGRVDADLAHDKAKTSYNSNLQFSLVTNNTDFAFGGREFRRSAVLVNVEGDKGSKGSFDVSTGSSARENAKVRAKTPIALSPFRNYKISLTPSKETLADFNEQTQEIGLMPGNVVTVTWRARESAIVIGKMFYEDGSIASNVEIYSSLETSQSDDDGSFQLYSYKDDKIISHTKDSKKCEAKIPDNVDFQGNGVAFIDDIKCVVNKVEVNDLATNKPETKNPEAKDLINE